MRCGKTFPESALRTCTNQSISRAQVSARRAVSQPEPLAAPSTTAPPPPPPNHQAPARPGVPVATIRGPGKSQCKISPCLPDDAKVQSRVQRCKPVRCPPSHHTQTQSSNSARCSCRPAVTSTPRAAWRRPHMHGAHRHSNTAQGPASGRKWCCSAWGGIGRKRMYP
jgi:hypothetical protein